MKKLLVSIIFAFVVIGSVHAGEFSRTILSSTTLQASTGKDATTSTVRTFDFDKLGFFIGYDETEVGNSVSATIVAQVSDNGTDWVTTFFHTYPSGATIDTVSLSVDGEYFIYMDRTIPKPYMRVNIAGNNIDVDDIAVIDVELVGTR